MATNKTGRAIPTELTLEQFREFVLPHLTGGRSCPSTKLTAHALFNYILTFLYTGCQWKQLPIANDEQGQPEIHYTRIYHAFRRWQIDGCFDAIFAGSLLALHEHDLLDTSMTPNINSNSRGRKKTKRGRKPLFDPDIFQERFNTIERVFGWEDKFRHLLLRFERISQLHYAFKTLVYTMINLRHFCTT
jgi:transposase